MDEKDRVFLISLGCAKNLVDSEHMLGLLRAKGFPLVSAIYEADTVVINTCAFIQPAVEESIDTILEAASLKKQGKLRGLVVTGCFVQRYGYKLLKEIPEVDGWLGTGEIHRIAEVLDEIPRAREPLFFIGRPLYMADHTVPRIQSTPFFSAYLRIAEGCPHRCAYCLIPSLRGPLRSRTMASLLEEAQAMVSRGVKEINLIAQDTTMYGKDLGGKASLETLLERLTQIRGVSWIRLQYAHPHGISERLLDLIDSEEVICAYIDLPFQHVNQEILTAMGREIFDESPWQLIKRIRSRGRSIALRTTFMVGFPGETEERFAQLLHFVRLARFERLGVFAFSPEKGTPAARLADQVERQVARKRGEKIMALQSRISRELNQALVGQTLPVLIEGLSPETDLLLTGRTATMAPDVDGRVLINKGEGATGQIVPVTIGEAHSYDLVGGIQT